MKSITTSQFSFERVIGNQNVYVDKTDLLANLARVDGGQYFISRPRRFGKSLMLSTLKCMFEGRKELFEGLKITKIDYDWKAYPVLLLDMANATGGSPAAIRTGLNSIAFSCAKKLGVAIQKDEDPSQTFLNLWEAIHDRNLQVVVLVDEYDMPLQGFLNDPPSLEIVRKMMHDFYVRLKSYSANIRFLMLTGVTKFAKLSVFSGLNQLNDLSMDADYAALLGYTHEELKGYFAEHLAAFAEKENTSSDAIFDQLLEWYDNYRFSPDCDVRVLNPVSVGYALLKRVFYAYWNSTGAPSLVMEALKTANRWPSDLNCVEVMKSDLDACDPLLLPVTPLLYQSGYLTIKDANDEFLTLGIPNKEVRNAIVRGHIATLIDQNKASEFNVRSVKAARALTEGNLEEAVGIFRMTIADLPYEWLIRDEGASKIAFLDFFQAMDGVAIHAERQIANGRIDAIVETSDAFYIFEFKYSRSTQEAFDQILENGYHKPYITCGKRVYGIGLNFNPKSGSRGIDEPIVRLLQG